jgi:hypothetical protein
MGGGGDNRKRIIPRNIKFTKEATMVTHDTSDNAKAFAKGLKKKEMDDLGYHVGCFFSLVVGIIAGLIFKSVFIGIVVFFVLGLMAWKAWYKE